MAVDGVFSETLSVISVCRGKYKDFHALRLVFLHHFHVSEEN